MAEIKTPANLTQIAGADIEADDLFVVWDESAQTFKYITLGDFLEEFMAGGTLTRSTKTGTGASAELVAASDTRKIVYVSSAETNSAAAIDPSGGTCALDVGISLRPGDTVTISGKEARSAMTFIASSGQKFTVYEG